LECRGAKELGLAFVMVREGGGVGPSAAVAS